MFEGLSMNWISALKYKYRQGNAILRILIINVGVFAVLAILNSGLFLMNMAGVSESVYRKLMLPASFTVFIQQPWSLITYMFLHHDFFHLLFNMLWLYWLGNLFQQYLGNSKSYQVYILGGVFGGIIFMLAYNIFPVFSGLAPAALAMGASAGVLSVVFATATLLPDYPVMLLLLGEVRLKYLALAALLIDIMGITMNNAGGHIAHIGGSAFGYLYIKYLYSNYQLPAFIRNLGQWFSNPFQKKSKLNVYHKGPQIRVESKDKPAQAEIDSILDKISRNGYESLSKKEKEILFKASKD